MKVISQEQAWEHYCYWQNTDKKILRKINELIKDIQRSPHEGIGKPEPLKHELSGFWSRRIPRASACLRNPIKRHRDRRLSLPLLTFNIKLLTLLPL